MKRGLGIPGYTVVEVMIVMAISSGLLIAAMIFVAGQRQRTEFSQSIREVESYLRDVINDVSTGYYANTANFTCDSANGRPRISAATADNERQGKNKDCVFLGRALQFGPEQSNREQFNVFNIIGLRQFNGPSGAQAAETYAQAKPTAMAPPTGAVTGFPDSTDRRRLLYNLRVASIKVDNQNYGGLAFMGSLTPFGSSGGNLLSGAQTVDVVPIPATSLDMEPGAFVDRVNALDATAVTKNPANGVVLCFQSGGTNEYGEITIGSNGRQLATDLQIKPGTCPA